MYIDHVNIKATSDLLATIRDFYCRVLGLKEGFRPSFRDNGYWLYAGDAALIHLSEVKTEIATGTRGTFDHFAIRLEDLSPVIAQLDDLAIKYSKSYVADVGLTQLFFEDPAGNRVEVQGRGELA